MTQVLEHSSSQVVIAIDPHRGPRPRSRPTAGAGHHPDAGQQRRIPTPAPIHPKIDERPFGPSSEPPGWARPSRIAAAIFLRFRHAASG